MKVRVVWAGPKAPFFYPVSPEQRTAVLARGFRARGNVRVFPQGWCEAAEAFRPAAIAGSKEQLTALLLLQPACLTHALIAIARPGENLVTSAERERLWRAFGVPLFQQIVDGSGLLRASECEAHNGLHIDSPEIAREEFHLEGCSLDETPCGCGKKTPRLRSAGQYEPERLTASAG